MEIVKELTAKVLAEAGKVIVGKEAQIKLTIMAIFAGGHVLFDDLPGTGKTTLVKTLSRALDCRFSRVQFTPDLLPSDITGLSVFNQRSGDFEVRHGPLMTNIFLADEINRAIPRTQSALLEAMEEMQVTIDGTTHALPEPFLVMATQNQAETDSTFRLPIAQMDRFLIRLSLGYPSQAEELAMLRTVGDEIPFDNVAAVLDAGRIQTIRKQLQAVRVSQVCLAYLVSVIDATRHMAELSTPAGPRGSRALYRASKVWAAMSGRDYVTPDDIKYLSPYLLPHRMTLTNKALLSGKTTTGVVGEILDATPVPPTNAEMISGA